MARATGSLTAPCCFDQRGGHAQQLGLGSVGIGDEAALEPLAGACQVGAGGGDHAASAAFGGGQHPAAREQLGRNLNQNSL
jgi:hypothetical protein